MEYRYIVPQGGAWLKANNSALGGGLWINTTPTGVTLPDDEIPALIAALQGYMSRRASELAKGGNGGR